MGFDYRAGESFRKTLLELASPKESDEFLEMSVGDIEIQVAVGWHSMPQEIIIEQEFPVNAETIAYASQILGTYGHGTRGAVEVPGVNFGFEWWLEGDRTHFKCFEYENEQDQRRKENLQLIGIPYDDSEVQRKRKAFENSHFYSLFGVPVTRKDEEWTGAPKFFSPRDYEGILSWSDRNFDAELAVQATSSVSVSAEIDKLEPTPKILTLSMIVGNTQTANLPSEEHYAYAQAFLTELAGRPYRDLSFHVRE